jgi:hypothetical protein
MRHHLISAGVSILFFCSCGSVQSGNSAGVGGSNSSAGTATASAGSSASHGGSPSSAAGTPGVAGSTEVAAAGAPTSSSGGAPSSSAGSVGSGGQPTGSAGSPVSTGGSGSGGAAATGSCTRASLTTIVDAYQAAQTAGDKTKMPLSSSPKLTENFKTVTTGIWDTALPMIAYRHDLLDTFACQTFSEVYVTDGMQEYVIGVHLTVAGSQISEIETIVTTGTVSGSTITSKDWNFDAKAYLTCAKSEDWSVVPEADRNTREELIAAGEAYFKIFSDKSTVVPWGTPCYRLEGGKGCTPAGDKASQSCDVGIPDNINFKSTHWVVDLDLNTAVGITQFGGAAPDSHTFRLIDGKIRLVHTLTQGTG